MRRALVSCAVLCLAVTSLLLPALPARGVDYSVAGIDRPDLVADCLSGLRRAVQAGDKEAVAALVAYPISVVLAGKRVPVVNAAEFLARYDAIVTPAVRKAVLDQNPDQVFVNYQGVMLGNGQVWLGLDGKVVRVIAINH